MKHSAPADPLQWKDEQLRYRVLRAVYDLAGADCEHAVTATEVGTHLLASYDELFRMLEELDRHGYLLRSSTAPRYCITPHGVGYIEAVSGRRRSVRLRGGASGRGARASRSEPSDPPPALQSSR